MNEMFIKNWGKASFEKGDTFPSSPIYKKIYDRF